MNDKTKKEPLAKLVPKETSTSTTTVVPQVATKKSSYFPSKKDKKR